MTVVNVIGDSRKIVNTAGQRVSLVPASLIANRVDITAFLENTGVICVGSNTVVAASGTRTGVPLSAGDTYSIEKLTDLLIIYIDSTVSGEGVSFTWWIGETN